MISRKIGWKEVCHAVRHDMFPVMATSMEAAIAELTSKNAVDSADPKRGQFDILDLSVETVDRVIVALHEKRPLSTMEVSAINKLLNRTRWYKEEGERLSLVLLLFEMMLTRD